MTREAVPATPRHEVHLAGPPAMGVALARAMSPSSRGDARVPAHALVIDHVAQDPARLAAYARICGFTLRDSVPPTWLHVLTFPLHVHLLGSSDSTVRLVGAVHVRNSMTLIRPVAATEQLRVRVHAEPPRPHAKGALVDLVGEVSVGSETVWTGVSTYLAQGARTNGDVEELLRDPFEPAQPQALWRLRKDLGRRYRAVSRDPNPIHTSRVMARAFGFPRPLVHGMWTHARALAQLEGRLPDSYTADVGFARPVLLPGTVGFHAASHDGGWRVAVTDRDGERPHLLMAVAQ